MTYFELLSKANRLLEKGEITIGQRDEMTKPLWDEIRPKGEWIIDGHHIRCNRCNEYICNTDREGNKIPDNFCPNCGADMRGKKDDR